MWNLQYEFQQSIAFQIAFQKLYMKAIDVICRDIKSTISWAAGSFLCWDMLRERMQFVAQSVGQALSELLNLHEKLLLDQDWLQIRMGGQHGFQKGYMPTVK